MIVRTCARLPGRPDAVWPLLCSSSRDGSRPCLFRLGVPKPVECRLPSGAGAVGARRECISNQGRVGQRITRWDPPRVLAFEMVETDLFFARHVDAVREQFELEPAGEGTRIVRTTSLHLKPRAAWVRPLLLGVGLKQVHWYVFRNWAATLRARTTNETPEADSGSPRSGTRRVRRGTAQAE
jgi:polyketide cyclase/dehydrase/lipid transport protein